MSASKSVNPVSDTIQIGLLLGLTRAYLLMRLHRPHLHLHRHRRLNLNLNLQYALKGKVKMAIFAMGDARMVLHTYET